MTITFEISSHHCTFRFSKVTPTTLSHSAHINRLVLATVPFHTCPAPLFSLSLPLAAIPFPPPSPPLASSQCCLPSQGLRAD